MSERFPGNFVRHAELPPSQAEQPAPARASRVVAVHDPHAPTAATRQEAVPILGKGHRGEAFLEQMEAPPIDHSSYAFHQPQVRQPVDVVEIPRRAPVRPSETAAGRRLAAAMQADAARHRPPAPASALQDASLREDLDALTARVADLAAGIEELKQIMSRRSRGPRK